MKPNTKLIRALLVGALIGTLAVAFIGVFAPTARAETWNMPTPYPDATFHTVNIHQFAKDVAAATGGDLEIKVHSAGSLFKHPEISKAVRSGQVPIGEFFMSLISNESPIFGADNLPFLATDYDQAQRLWAAQRPLVEKLLDRQGMLVLFAVTWPPQGLYTKKSIATVADLKGLKLRSYNATLEKFANLAGAAPTQVEVPDIPQAFSTGRVEAMITSPSTGVNSKVWDYLSHYTDIQAWVPKNVVVVNKRAFRKLSKSNQKAVLKAARAAEARGWAMSRKENSAKVAELTANGIKVEKPTAALTKGLKDIGEKLIADWKVEAGADGEKFLSSYSK